jgi:uncharacterized protein
LVEDIPMNTILHCAMLAMAALLWASPTFAADERELTLPTDGASLKGTLTLPDGVASVPAVLMLAGSGPTDRDGNSHLAGGGMLRNDSLKMLADALAVRGIASLRVDKRGAAASKSPGLDEASLRFDAYVADARAWAELLAKEPRVDRLFMLGHSEGGLVATLAAQQAPVAGLILVAGAGEPAGQVLRRQFAAGAMPPELRAAAERILTQMESGHLVSDPPPALAALFRASVQPYLISWLPLDPAAELMKVKAPVLIVQGTTDIQVSADDARRLANARSDARLLLIDGMNHVLKLAPADRAANAATYGDPSLPLAPGLVDAVATFVGAANR